MTPATYQPSRRRWLTRLATRRPRRRAAGASPALLRLLDVASETVEVAALFAQSESSSGLMASGRYRR